MTRNNASAQIKLSGPRSELIQESKRLKLEVSKAEGDLQSLEQSLLSVLSQLPNTTHPDTPKGDESMATLIKTIGTPRVSCGNAPLKDHIELGQMHDLVDFERAGKITGSSFYYLKNAGALLEMALSRYALDICIRHGFTPVLPPDVIRSELVDGCGFKPRSEDPQTYFVHHSNPDQEPKLCLTATAEFPLAGMYAQETLSKKQLPIKMVALGRAFRAEGQAGSINRGLYRVHQFSKVEMFGLCEPLESQKLFNEITAIQEEIYSGLDLCFRVLNMPTLELGAPAYQKFDMEAWMPGRKSWGEISSASNCTDYQSRRLKIKYLSQSNASNSDYVHTVNGTAAAIPRLLIALLETHQTAEGDIRIPPKLRKYFLGDHVDLIRPQRFGKEMKLNI